MIILVYEQKEQLLSDTFLRYGCRLTNYVNALELVMSRNSYRFHQSDVFQGATEIHGLIPFS